MSWDGLKLKDEAKTRWLADLRSGKFTQGKEALCLDLPDLGCVYCCLGVYARGKDIPFVNDEDIEIDQSVGDSRVLQFNGYQAETLLPDEWFSEDFEDVDPHGFDRVKEDRVHDLQSKLAGMNDEGTSFAEIADWVETNL